MTRMERKTVLDRIKTLPRTRTCRTCVLTTAALGGTAAWIALATGHAGWLLPVAALLFVAAGVCTLMEPGSE